MALLGSHLLRSRCQVNGVGDLPTACLLLGELGLTPVGSSITAMGLVSSKLMALDALWCLGSAWTVAQDTCLSQPGVHHHHGVSSSLP